MITAARSMTELRGNDTQRPYPFHEIADDYANFTREELAALTEDIRAHGQIRPAAIWRGQIVDGRHRALVCEQLGRPLLVEDITAECPTEEAMRARVRSLNEHRRARIKPLSNAEKRMRIDEELKTNPKRSDRAIAEEVGVDNHTVAAVREGLIPQPGNFPTSGIRSNRNGHKPGTKRRMVEEAFKADPTRSSQALAKELNVAHSYVAEILGELKSGAIKSDTTVPIKKTAKRANVEAALKTDSSRSNSAIAESIGVCSKFVGQIRAGLNIKNVKTAPVGNGCRIEIGTESSLAELCRRGMRMEEETDISAEAAASQLHIGSVSYRQARAILKLSDADGLSQQDKALLAQAIEQMNTERRTQSAYALIEPLVVKMWGNGSHNERTVHKRVEKFETAIVVITEACTCGETIDLPHLTEKQLKSALVQLAAALTALNVLRKRLKKELANGD